MQTDILAYIPQRPPFVMIDEVLQADETVLRSAFTIREDNILVDEGHLSESGLVENMAQTAAAGTGVKAQREGRSAPVGFIGALKNLKVQSLPKVGDTITTEIVFVHTVMNANIVQGKVFLENREIAQCELKIFLQQ